MIDKLVPGVATLTLYKHSSLGIGLWIHKSLRPSICSTLFFVTVRRDVFVGDGSVKQRRNVSMAFFVSAEIVPHLSQVNCTSKVRLLSEFKSILTEESGPDDADEPGLSCSDSELRSLPPACPPGQNALNGSCSSYGKTHLSIRTSVARVPKAYIEEHASETVQRTPPDPQRREVTAGWPDL